MRFEPRGSCHRQYLSHSPGRGAHSPSRLDETKGAALHRAALSGACAGLRAGRVVLIRVCLNIELTEIDALLSERLTELADALIRSESNIV